MTGREFSSTDFYLLTLRLRLRLRQHKYCLQGKPGGAPDTPLRLSSSELNWAFQVQGDYRSLLALLDRLRSLDGRFKMADVLDPVLVDRLLDLLSTD